MSRRHYLFKMSLTLYKTHIFPIKCNLSMTNLKWKRSNTHFVDGDDGYIMDYCYCWDLDMFSFSNEKLWPEQVNLCIYCGISRTNDVDFVDNLELGMLKYFSKYISNSPSRRSSDNIIFISSAINIKINDQNNHDKERILIFIPFSYPYLYLILLKQNF